MKLVRRRIKLLVLGTAAMLAGCSDNRYIGDQGLDSNPADAPISFQTAQKAVTRADLTGAEAAHLLGDTIYVYGTKTVDDTEINVFDTYSVGFDENAMPTGWVYDGLRSKGTKALQRTKFWDYSADRYDFVAAAGLGDGEVITSVNDGIRVNVTDVDRMTSIYVANRITATPVSHAATGTAPATMAYNQTVRFHFRRLGAQMRIGFYEDIPGYAVRDLVFYYIGAPSGSRTVGVGAAFPESGHYTVGYSSATNAATARFVGGANKFAFSGRFGTLQYTGALSDALIDGLDYIDENGTPVATAVNKFLSSSAAAPTYGQGLYTIDGQAGVTSTYRPILPNMAGNLPMQLRVDFTLVSTDGSKEVIHVRDASVTVPAQFMQWKPNTSYTYIFKITDASNGYTGPGGGGTPDPETGGRQPDPTNGGGDNDPHDVDGDDIPDAPYIPDPSYPLIPNPDYDPTDPNSPDSIPDPATPFIPNPDYPSGPKTDGGDPSNPVDPPTIPNPDYDPTDPDSPAVIPDPENPGGLFPIVFDAFIIEVENEVQTVYTTVDGTDNSSLEEH